MFGFGGRPLTAIPFLHSTLAFGWLSCILCLLHLPQLFSLCFSSTRVCLFIFSSSHTCSLMILLFYLYDSMTIFPLGAFHWVFIGLRSFRHSFLLLFRFVSFRLFLRVLPYGPNFGFSLVASACLCLRVKLKFASPLPIVGLVILILAVLFITFLAFS